MASTRVRVTGLGLITPIGSGADEFWSSLVEGRAGAREVRSFDTEGLPGRVGCEVLHFEPSPAVRRASLGGRCTRLALAAVEQALADARLDTRGATDVAVVVGTTMGEVTRFERDRAARAEHEPSVADVRSLVHRPMDVMGRSVSRLGGLGGPVVTVPAACAAGGYAIGVAASMIARGEVRAALAVGSEAFSRLAFVGFSRLRAMSPDHCRPFSKNRPGLLLGEGSAALVLESEEAAEARGAASRGTLEAFGLSCDAHHVTGPHPEGAGAARAMEGALQRAGIAPRQVDWINAHGTGTPHNDRTESLALSRVFGARAAEVPVSSIKALTGHTMGAAGAIEAAASLLAMRHGVIPPTWNWEEADPDCAVDCVPNRPREARLEWVLSNSYAFGGNNASLLFRAPEA